MTTLFAKHEIFYIEGQNAGKNPNWHIGTECRIKNVEAAGHSFDFICGENMTVREDGIFKPITYHNL